MGSIFPANEVVYPHYYTYLYRKYYTCMTTKLTLTLDDRVIEGAKRYARAKGRSVSELVESYFKSLIELNSEPSEELTPSVKSLMGSFKAPANFDYKKILKEEKQRKFE